MIATTPLSRSLSELADLEDLGALGKPAGHGLSPGPGMRTGLRRREADRARIERLADEPAHLRHLVGGRRAFGGVVAQHVRAQRRMPDHHRDVQPGLLPLDRVEVLGKRLEGPRNAGGQRVDRHSLDVLEGAGDRLAVLRLRRRDAETAVAHHHGGDAVPAGRSQIRVPQHLRVVVRMTVDEARCEHQPLEVDDLVAVGRSGVRDLDDPITGDRRRPQAAAAAPVPSMSSALRSTRRGSPMNVLLGTTTTHQSGG